jgi:hypothetical protein
MGWLAPVVVALGGNDIGTPRCRSWVPSAPSVLNRPAGDPKLAARSAELAHAGCEPSDLAAQVSGAIKARERYVFTHPDGDWRAELEERFEAIHAAMAKAAATR